MSESTIACARAHPLAFGVGAAGGGSDGVGRGS
jgi:hypothetical protein